MINDEEPYEDQLLEDTHFLYAWGKNEDGELGLGSVTKVHTPKFIKTSFYPRQISSAHKHSILVTSDGLVYVAGSPLHDKLGIKTDVIAVKHLTLNPNFSRSLPVKQVACGAYHTLALTEAGQVYAWGGTLYGKTGNKSYTVSVITHLQKCKVTQIACGDFHSIALTDKGEIYSWGGGGHNKNKGQLGHSNFKDCQFPEQIMFFKNKPVKTVACGDYHVMAVTQDGEVYAWGEGNYGQLGTGGKEESHTPRKVVINFNTTMMMNQYFMSDTGKEKPRVEQIALGGKHSLLLTNKGHLYVCGYGSQGQLGMGPGKTENVTEPTLVSCFLSKKIIKIAAGSNHSLVLTDRHDVYACGYNQAGQLGLGDQKFRTNWTLVTQLSGKRITRIYAGGYHSWAVVDRHSPNIDNYEPPSPLRVGNFSEQMGRSHEIPRIDNKSAVSNMTLIDVFDEIATNNTLEVLYTDVQLCHRFIRFTVKEDTRAKERLEEYLAYCYETEKGQLKHHRLTHDGDLHDANKNLISSGDKRRCTLMMVSDSANYNPSKMSSNKSESRVSIPIGEMAILKEDQLKVDGRIPPYNRWFFKFIQMFEGIVDKPRFLEMRPKLG